LPTSTVRLTAFLRHAGSFCADAGLLSTELLVSTCNDWSLLLFQLRSRRCHGTALITISSLVVDPSDRYHYFDTTLPERGRSDGVICVCFCYWREWLEKDGHPFWPFWENVRSGWEIRHLPNAKFIHYGSLKSDVPRMMRQNAEFLQIDVAEDRWESIIEYCSFDWMKRNATKSVPLGGAFWDAGAQLFINKGTNGRWRDELSADESPKYEQDARQELGPFWRRWLSQLSYLGYSGYRVCRRCAWLPRAQKFRRGRLSCGDCRLSITSVILSASGYWTSTSFLTVNAQSLMARRSLTLTWHVPVSGSNIMNRLATPLRMYSCWNRAGQPGEQGLPRFPNQLLAGLIQAEHRPLRVIRSLVDRIKFRAVC
jgi:hypothetical protein